MGGKIVSRLLGHLRLTRTQLTLVCLQTHRAFAMGPRPLLPLLPPHVGGGACSALEGGVLGHVWGSPVCWLSLLCRDEGRGSGSVWPALQTLQGEEDWGWEVVMEGDVGMRRRP